MKLYAIAFACAAACGGSPVVEDPARAPDPELALVESNLAIDGSALPPRADSPRTLVMFFASW